ncbi:MAG: hypothetical protein A2X20_00315 [Bacteroidetes bacterium GWE2_40_15]|nr:MAG: hypothetical protein A2X20_00315 [Bacteroidetes bacterium GWE2_40_15]
MIENYFETTNFYLATFLCSSGIKLLRIDQTEGDRRSKFVFLESEKRQELVNAFLVEKNTKVEVHEFITQIKRLKSALYDS